MKKERTIVDVFVRPLANQTMKVVYSDKAFDLEKYCYDVCARALTINQTQFLKKFNNGFKIDFGKTFLRTTFSAASNYFLEMMS